MIFKSENTTNIEKQGVKMHIYNTKEECSNAAVDYQETGKGHTEEFYHEKSAIIQPFFRKSPQNLWFWAPKIRRIFECLIKNKKTIKNSTTKKVPLFITS